MTLILSHNFLVPQFDVKKFRGSVFDMKGCLIKSNGGEICFGHGEDSLTVKEFLDAASVSLDDPCNYFQFLYCCCCFSQVLSMRPPLF
jgi:hypothetical protein